MVWVEKYAKKLFIGLNSSNGKCQFGKIYIKSLKCLFLTINEFSIIYAGLLSKPKYR
jgi:hypothetical protein